MNIRLRLMLLTKVQASSRFSLSVSVIAARALPDHDLDEPNLDIAGLQAREPALRGRQLVNVGSGLARVRA